MTQADSVHSTPPTNTSDALYLPTDVSPEQIFQAIGQLRKEARDAIDELIRFLDKTDDYVSRELEDAVDDVACDDADEGNAEPSLGWTEQEARRGRHAEVGGCFDCDREGDAHEDDEDGVDAEGDELQHGGDEHDGCEPDECKEPSLGWTTDGCMQNDQGDREADEDGRTSKPARPQNRTQVRPSIEAMKRLRAGIPQTYTSTVRFDRCMESIKDETGDMLKGGQLSFPGGQQAFDAAMNAKLR